MNGIPKTRMAAIVLPVVIATIFTQCTTSSSGGTNGGQAITNALPAPPEHDLVSTYVVRDAFYDPPTDLPTRAGALLRSDGLTNRDLPEGTQAWRILYTTTFNDGRVATAVATVLHSTTLPSGPRPVISWQHATVGLVQKCMPSLATAPFKGIPALDQALAEGWVIVATDYASAGAGGVHPYLIGEGEVRSALDAVRAARELPGLTLDGRTVVWGHSQGGHAALWAGILASRYAPDVKVVGIVPIAPVTDLPQLVTLHGTSPSGAALGAFLAGAYSQFYPDVEFGEVVRPEAHDVARQIANECNDPATADPAGTLERLNGIPAIPDFTKGAFGRRLEENVPDEKIDAPVLIVQGRADNIAFAFVNDEYVNERCAAGQRLEYWTFAGADHSSIVGEGSPLAPGIIDWTRDRFAGKAPPLGCVRRLF